MVDSITFPIVINSKNMFRMPLNALQRISECKSAISKVKNFPKPFPYVQISLFRVITPSIVLQAKQWTYATAICWKIFIPCRNCRWKFSNRNDNIHVVRLPENGRLPHSMLNAVLWNICWSISCSFTPRFGATYKFIEWRYQLHLKNLQNESESRWDTVIQKKEFLLYFSSECFKTMTLLTRIIA